MVNAGLMKWLCHDLATPVATILTASELLGPDEDQEIRDLVGDGAKRLAARLRLIRAALAPASSSTAGPALARLIAEATGAQANWSGSVEPLESATASVLAGLALALPGREVMLADRALRVDGRPPPADVMAALSGETDAQAGNHAALAATVAAMAAAAGLRLVASTDAGSTQVEIVAA